jgi:hypothetical protein
LTCKKFVKCATKNRNLCMSQLPSIFTFALHLGGINEDGREFLNEYIRSLRFGDRMEDVILGAVT